MKRILYLLFIQFFILNCSAQIPPFAFAKSIGNAGSDEYITGMKVDNSGNIYITGFFSGTLDFDPGTATHNLISNGATDIYIAKYNSNGVYQWAYSIGDTGYDEGDDLVIDDSSNVYVCGYYNGNPDFDPGPNTHYLGANALENAFYIKLSKNGNYLRSASYTSTNSEIARAIVVDAAHNVYVAGVCHSLTIGTSNLGTHGAYDIFIAKTNVSGTLQWAKEMGGSADDNVSNMDIDNLGNIFVSGSFSGTDFDVNPTLGTYIFSSGGANSNSFMASLTSAGGFNWGNNWGSNLADDYGEDIAADGNGESFQAANFGISIESVARRDNAGNGFWGVPSTGATALAVQSMVADAAHSVFIGGYLAGSMTWNGPSLGSAGSTDIYVSKWNIQSTQQWQFRLGGVGADAVQEIALGPNNTIFIGGIFSGNVNFNPATSPANYLTSVGGTDMFIMRLGTSITGIEEKILNPNSFYAYPNPVSDNLNISFSKTAMNKSTLRLYSIDGKCLLSKEIVLTNENLHTLDVSFLPAGIFLLDIQQGEKHEHQRIFKIE